MEADEDEDEDDSSASDGGIPDKILDIVDKIREAPLNKQAAINRNWLRYNIPVHFRRKDCSLRRDSPLDQYKGDDRLFSSQQWGASGEAIKVRRAR